MRPTTKGANSNWPVCREPIEWARVVRVVYAALAVLNEALRAHHERKRGERSGFSMGLWTFTWGNGNGALEVQLGGRARAAPAGEACVSRPDGRKGSQMLSGVDRRVSEGDQGMLGCHSMMEGIERRLASYGAPRLRMLNCKEIDAQPVGGARSRRHGMYIDRARPRFVGRAPGCEIGRRMVAELR